MMHDNTNTQGLTGFGKWLRRNLDTITTVLSAVGLGQVGAALSFAMDAFNIGERFDSTLNIELNTYEEAVLDDWNIHEFKPSYQELSGRVYALLPTLHNTFFDTKLEKINEILSLMCYIQQYYIGDVREEYTQNMVLVRNEYIKISFDALRNYIAEKASEYDLMLEVVSRDFSNYNFLPLQITTSNAQISYCDNYVLPNYNGLPDLVPPPKGDLPNTVDPLPNEIITINPIPNESTGINPIPYIPVSDVNPSYSETQDDGLKSKSNWLWWLIPAFITYKIVTKQKKENH